MKTQERGFTLIEIAIVLVIIGLLLGGVLKGQELITGARVRNLIQQQDGVKAAYFGFLDRYRALPGDYAAAQQNIRDATADGNGNGVIEAVIGAGVPNNESVLVWEHLSRSQFINGAFTYAAAAADASNPRNPYGAFITVVHDGAYGAGAQAVRPNFKTGNRIPVEILAEIDRKVDDGLPDRGSFQRFDLAGGGVDAADPLCTADPGGGQPRRWAAEDGIANCAGAMIF
jgi:prepilin-type N-terminal cleavage/methylation domain-containing protein